MYRGLLGEAGVMGGGLWCPLTVGLFTTGRCWILGEKQGLMLNGLLEFYSQKQPARLGTVKLVKWLIFFSLFQFEDEPLLS